MTARLADDLAGSGLKNGTANAPVEIVSRQIIRGELYSLTILLPGHRQPVKLAPRFVVLDEPARCPTCGQIVPEEVDHE
jgi:hypothetical protein